MKTWFPPQELAGMPGMPTTDKGVHIRAKKEGWRSRKREYGKGCEYALEDLPEVTRVYLQPQQESLPAIDPLVLLHKVQKALFQAQIAINEAIEALES